MKPQSIDIFQTRQTAGEELVSGVNATVRVEISVISLSSATARRQATSAMLDGGGLEWSYFDAHTALQCKELRYDEGLAKRLHGQPLSPQQIAVYSSHYGVWKAFVENGRSAYLLVLEDDIILDTDFPVGQFAAFCLRYNISYMRLFSKNDAPATHMGFFFDRSILRYKFPPCGTQAYLVSVAGAKRLMENCRSITAPVDVVMDRFWKTELPLYAIFPYPVIERYVPTSIPIRTSKEGKVSRIDSFMRKCNRAVDKVRRIRANMRLHRQDGRMRKLMPTFSQIHAKDTP